MSYPPAALTSMESLAKILKALGDANRLGIISSIGKEARSVTEIIDATGLSQTLVSFHLRVLRDAGIVKTERDGPFIYYSLSEPVLLDIIAELSNKINLNT
ncbi:MAG: helix-turn-helix transcriptional regulator [Nitrospirae bacterium]|nr:helix-turn-helix transcriptional regulator [Nitrospirota bacterium]